MPNVSALAFRLMVSRPAGYGACTAMSVRACLGAASCALWLAGCGGGPSLGRLGEPVSLPNGAPRNDCERQDWYELVPSRVEGEGATLSGQIQRHQYEGYGIYQPGESDPEDVEDVLPRFEEPELQQKHVAIIDEAEDGLLRSLFWITGGLAGMVAGVGTAGAIDGESRTAANVAGLTGIAMGVGGLVMTIISFPSPKAQADAEARQKIFVPGEDDIISVKRGTNRANGERRRACGGVPAPDETAASPSLTRRQTPSDPAPPAPAP